METTCHMMDAINANFIVYMGAKNANKVFALAAQQSQDFTQRVKNAFLSAGMGSLRAKSFAMMGIICLLMGASCAIINVAKIAQSAFKGHVMNARLDIMHKKDSVKADVGME